MIYCVPSSSAEKIQGMNEETTAVMTSPKQGVSSSVLHGWRWAGDNGAFTGAFNEKRFFHWLERMRPHAGRCLFVNCPDVYPDARATLAQFYQYAPRIKAMGFPIGLVGQNGLDCDEWGVYAEDMAVPWSDFDVFFVGGDTDWKISQGRYKQMRPAEKIIAEARKQGKEVHAGRVNSLKRFAYFETLGVMSCDGTGWKYNPTRSRVQIANWTSQSSFWGYR